MDRTHAPVSHLSGGDEMSCCNNNVSYELMQRMVIPVQRENKVDWKEGLPYSTCKEEFQIRGIIFPITGRDLLLVPEGDRFQQNIWIYTQQDLRVNDVATYAGQPYEVQNVSNWDSYNQARAMRLDVGPDGVND